MPPKKKPEDSHRAIPVSKAGDKMTAELLSAPPAQPEKTDETQHPAKSMEKKPTSLQNKEQKS